MTTDGVSLKRPTSRHLGLSQRVDDFDLPGYAAAISLARQIARDEGRFVVDPEQSIEQGKNNRVVTGLYDGIPAVLKYFDDSINKSRAVERKGTEAFLLRHFSAIEAVPKLVAEHGQALIMSRRPGLPLADAIGRPQQRDVLDKLLESAGKQIGVLLGHMASIELSATDALWFADNLQDGLSVVERVEAVLARAECVCAGEPTIRPYAETLTVVRKTLPHLADEPPMPYRYDNNFRNWLVDGDTVVGLVDYELSFLGTETMLLGALLDTVPSIYPLFPDRPSWSSVRHGYEATRRTRIDSDWFRLIVAMAMFNHWVRVTWAYRKPGDLGRYARRFASRFPILVRLYDS